jgi:hypothetical protein
MMKHACVAVSLGTTLVLSAGNVAPAPVGPYTFTNIADTTGPFSFFNAFAPINEGGTVAFHAMLASGNFGIFTGRGGTVTTIVEAGGSITAPSFPDINAGGTVSFVADLPTGDQGVFTRKNRRLIVIADTSGPFSAINTPPAINARGMVAFRAELDTGGERIVSVDDGRLTIVSDTSGPLDRFGFVAINSNGTVAFNAGLDGGGFGIFRGRGGPLTTIATSQDPSNSFGAPAVNANGTVAFPGPSGSGFAVLTGNGRRLTTIVDWSGPFNAFQFTAVAINDPGTVAFSASREIGVPFSGIFTGPDPLKDKVIGTGDPLFGSTVARVGFFSSMPFLNNAGQVGFWYELADGRSGVARANPAF